MSMRNSLDVLPGIRSGLLAALVLSAAGCVHFGARHKEVCDPCVTLEEGCAPDCESCIDGSDAFPAPCPEVAGGDACLEPCIEGPVICDACPPECPCEACPTDCCCDACLPECPCDDCLPECACDAVCDGAPEACDACADSGKPCCAECDAALPCEASCECADGSACETCSACGQGPMARLRMRLFGWMHHRSNAIPDTLPLGSTVRAHYQVMETNAEAADFIFHRHDFVGKTVQLTPDARDKVPEIAARMRMQPFPVLIERSEHNSDPGLDQQRREFVAGILTSLGAPDADRRTIVAPAYGKGYNGIQAERSYYQYLNQGGGGFNNGFGGNSFGGFGGNFGGGFGGGF